MMNLVLHSELEAVDVPYSSVEGSDTTVMSKASLPVTKSSFLTSIKILFLSFFILIKSQYGMSQDLHFSQYFNAPLLVNPANTGFEPDVDWRIGINYRNQWANLISNPYKTMSVWGDAQLVNNRFDYGWMGIGGAILRDQAGSGGLTSTRASASVAYHQLLGFSSLLSGGFNIGWTNKRIDQTKLTFDNQWNGKFFDTNVPSGENFSTNSINYFDLTAGMNYAYFPTENAYINVGFSAAHINRPKETFFSNNPSDTRLAVRYTGFLNGAFKLNNQWILNPNAYVSNMGNAWETVFGMNANYNLSGDGVLLLIAGLYVRDKDAVIPIIGFQVNGYKLTFNYDVTTSALGAYNQKQGAYEFSLVKTGVFNPAGKALKCPSVKF